MTYDFSNYKQDKISKPRNEAWGNWMKFEKVGDKVQGYIRDVFYRPAEGEFKEARGFTVEQADGVLINVATKRLPFILSETDDFRIGDPITIELTELKKSDTKGFSPTKIFQTYGAHIVTEGKTVRELEAEDMKYGGSKAPETTKADDDFDAVTKAVDAPPFP